MYTVLLVEDEAIIRRGLAAKIRHLGLPVAEIYEAEDGTDALELLETAVPDIVVTDIRLLHIDGLSMVEQILRGHPGIEVVVVSGYSEFDYAQKAISLGVVSYLVKPVGLAELRGALEKCIAQLESRRYARRDWQVLQRQNEDLERQYGVSKLLFGQSAQETRRLFPGAGCFALAAVAVAHRSLGEGSRFSRDDLNLIRYALVNVIQDLAFGEGRTALNHLQNNNQVLILFDLANPSSYGTVVSYCRRLIEVVRRSLRIEINIYLSAPHERPGPALVEETRMAADQKVLGRDGVLLCYARAQAEAPDAEVLRYLRGGLQGRHVRQVEEALDRLLAEEHRTAGYYRRLYLEIAGMLEEEQHLVEPFGAQLREAAVSMADQFYSGEYVRAFVEERLVRALVSEDPGPEGMSNAARIRYARQYIERHYDEPLSVNQLAELFRLNPNYFSTLFKKETGKTVVQTINRVRVERACHLLETTGVGAAELSGMIGYESVNYFYKQFKKYTGVTPAEYRNSRRTEE